MSCLFCFAEVTSVPVKRKSAFERLGKEEESHVPKEMERLSPKIKITKVTKSPITAPPASTVISLVKVSELRDFVKRKLNLSSQSK